MKPSLRRARDCHRLVGVVATRLAPAGPRPKGARVNTPMTDRVAALIAWMLVVRVGILVKDGAISAVTRVFDALRRRRLRRSSILDKNANSNRVLSKRSRPLSGPSDTSLGAG